MGDRNTYAAGLVGEVLWETWRAIDGDPSASILRFAEAEGAPHAGIAPGRVPIPGLAMLDVAVSQPGVYRPDAHPGLTTLLQAGERQFVFRDLPAAGSIPACTLLATDIIEFEGARWRLAPGREVHNDRQTGLSSMVCVRVAP